MKRLPLSRFLPSRLALLVAPLLAAWPLQSRAADGVWTGATGGAWLTLTNWNPNTGFPGAVAATVAGEGTASDIAGIDPANAATNFGINLNTSGGLMELGALDWNKTNTATVTIGNSSTTVSGILQLNGATVNAVANTLVRVNNEANLVLTNDNSGTDPVTMGVRLGITNGVFFVGQNGAAAPALRTLTINSIISELNAGSGFTKTGNGVLTLTAANQMSGAVSILDGSVRLQNAAAGGTASILVSNSDGSAPANNVDVLVTGGNTYNNALTMENTTNQNARTRLHSTNTVNANANTWAGNITFKGPGQNQGFVADTAPLVINGNMGQDATPSPLIFLRGANAGTINGNINLGAGALFKTDPGSWTISSTGNVMGTVQVADGLLILNNNDAVEADSVITMGQGTGTTGRLQVNAGFTQQVTGITNASGSTSATGHSINGPGTLDFGAVNRNVTVPDNTATFSELTINAPLTGSGGFTKLDAGNLLVNSTSTAPVTVSGGGLGGTGTLAGGVTVNAPALLGGGTALAAGTLNVVGVTLNAGSNLAVNLGSGGNDFIANTGPLTSAGAAINVIPNGSLTAGQDIPVIGYTGVSPTTAPFTVGGLFALGSRATASVVDLGTSIGLHIDSADKIIWTGTAGTAWDIATTANWKLQSDSSSTTFQQFDALIFDDSGTNTAITLTGATTPVRAEFRNTAPVPYSITGAGGMGGTMVLDKTGDGTTTLENTNTYTGETNVAAGTLTANFNPGAAMTPIPALSPVSIAAGAKLRVIANDAALTMASRLSGAGTVEFNAHAVAGSATAHQVTFSGNNTGFTGNIVMQAPLTGTYRFTNVTPASLGSATIEVQSGAQVLAAPSQVFSNNISISGIGWLDANGNLGALRIDNTRWDGDVNIVGTARICAHNTAATTAGIVSGDISGGDLEVNVSNYNNSYYTVFTGNNSYGTTTIGGGNTQTAGVPSMRLNIGQGGTTGTLGSGPVTINGDGANGVLGFDRSDGYTLLPGQTITGGGSNLARTFLDIETLGAGFNANGNAITLGTSTVAGGGQIRVAQNRAGAIANFASSVTAGQLLVGGGQRGTAHMNSGAIVNVGNLRVGATAITSNGSVLNINPGATVTAEGPDIGIGDQNLNSGTVNQSGGTFTVGTPAAAARFRLAHWPNAGQTSFYHLTGGTLDLPGPAPVTTPSITGNPEISGGVIVGVDGHGIFNQSGASTVRTNFVLLDARAATATAGEDQYNLDGGTLELKSIWGIIARHPLSTKFTLNGGIIDNTAPAGTAVMIDAPLTVGASGGTLDTSDATSSFVLTGNVTGAGNTITTTGGGEVTLHPNGKTVLDGTSDGLGITNIDVIIAGNASVEKAGTGTTTLAAANTYSGGTTVNAGKLMVNGSVTGAAMVSTGGTLGGTGTLGTVTVASGAIVAPGLSVGALTFGSLDLQAGSRYEVEITGAATSDKVIVTGALTANGTIAVTLTGYVPVSGDTFDIADAGSIAGTPAFDFSAAVLPAGLTWDTTQFSTNGTIRVSAPSDPFDAWAASFGLTGGKNGDDDKDGASNLLEFATNSNPSTVGSGARAYARLHPLGGDNVLTLTVAVRKTAVFTASGAKQTATIDRVVYTVEASDDLVNWNTVVVTELNAADSTAVQAALSLPPLDADWEWHSFRTDGGTTADPRDMIRLSVAAQP